MIWANMLGKKSSKYVVIMFARQLLQTMCGLMHDFDDVVEFL